MASGCVDAAALWLLVACSWDGLTYKYAAKYGIPDETCNLCEWGPVQADVYFGVRSRPALLTTMPGMAALN